MHCTCPSSCDHLASGNNVSVKWTIWEGGLGEQPSSKVSLLLLPPIFSLTGPQQRPHTILSGEYVLHQMHVHTHTHTTSPELVIGLHSKTRQELASALAPLKAHLITRAAQYHL